MLNFKEYLKLQEKSGHSPFKLLAKGAIKPAKPSRNFFSPIKTTSLI
jgi:hypothetical protein